jgi:hypothetical protein
MTPAESLELNSPERCPYLISGYSTFNRPFWFGCAGWWEIGVMNVDGSKQRPLLAAEALRELSIQYNNVNERVISWQ